VPRPGSARKSHGKSKEKRGGGRRQRYVKESVNIIPEKQEHEGGSGKIYMDAVYGMKERVLKNNSNKSSQRERKGGERAKKDSESHKERDNQFLNSQSLSHKKNEKILKRRHRRTYHFREKLSLKEKAPPLMSPS